MVGSQVRPAKNLFLSMVHFGVGNVANDFRCILRFHIDSSNLEWCLRALDYQFAEDFVGKFFKLFVLK